MKDDLFLNNLIGVFATSITTRMETAISALGGRSLSHDSALVLIHSHPGDSIDALRKSLDLTHSGAVRLINTLEKEDLVDRLPSPEDRRAVRLYLTEKGKEQVQTILDVRSKAIESSISELSDEQRAALRDIIETALPKSITDQVEAKRVCRYCDLNTCFETGCPIYHEITSRA
ncbi:MarR family transcriptional regulator [Alteromonadaceae bacterium M269]|nr:MarR family transcriptional regulator [Alteromonadaceae bacterium M269]